MTTRLARWAAALALPAALVAQPALPKTITIGTVDTLYSATLKEKRPYLVYLPPSYSDTVYTQRKYPVLYLLDGDAHFHSVTGLLQILGTGVNGTYVVPEMIVIAIPNTNRMRDLTPTAAITDPDGKPNKGFGGGGGMPQFLKFMQTELLPHIDSAYRTAPYRVFVGHSLGGLTTIDALYTMPQTFNAYLAIDPSLWWDHRLLLSQAKGFFTGTKPAGRTLYVAQANTLAADDSLPNGHFASIVQFNRVAEAYNKGGIRYGFKYYGDDDHGSVPLIAEYDALRFVFDFYRMDLLSAMSSTTNLTAHYDQISRNMGYAVLPPEGMVDMLSQVARGQDSTKVEPLLQLNAQLYPNSAHAFVALGDFLRQKKDSARARTAFARAVALKPANAYAREALKKLGGTQ